VRGGVAADPEHDGVARHSARLDLDPNDGVGPCCDQVDAGVWSEVWEVHVPAGSLQCVRDLALGLGTDHRRRIVHEPNATNRV
jgi:hypothetical protein